MINYSMKRDKNKYKIVEESTGYVLLLTKTKKHAITMTNWLNAGGSFDGWTPHFFVDKDIQ